MAASFVSENVVELRSVIDLLAIVPDRASYDKLVDVVFANNHINASVMNLKNKHFRAIDLNLLVHHFSKGNPTSAAAVARILRKLIDLGLVDDLNLDLLGAYPYAWNKRKISALIDRDILTNLLCGAPYIVDRYRSSVVAIEVEKTGDVHVGTGFYIVSPKHGDVLVTAKHNIDPSEGVSVLGLVGAVPSIFRVKSNWNMHPGADLAFAQVERTGKAVPINLATKAQVLDETITLGFPKVSTANDAYLLAHRGELNAKIVSYQDAAEYLLISNTVSPGSSGSPVLNLEGEAIGLVVRSLETKHEGGVTAVSSAIPASSIFEFVESTRVS